MVVLNPRRILGHLTSFDHTEQKAAIVAEKFSHSILDIKFLDISGNLFVGMFPE